jgi:hypothetical protein
MASILSSYVKGTDSGDATFAGNSTSAQTDTITVPSGTNRKCIVFAGGEENEPNPTVDSITLGGNSLTKIGEVSAGSASFHNAIAAFYLNEANFPATGSQTLSISFSGVDAGDNDWDYFHWCVIFLDDADQGGFTTSEYDTETGASTASVTFSPGVSVANGDLCLISGNTSGSTTFSATGYSDVDEGSVSMSGAAFYCLSKAITGSGTETPTPTAGSSQTRINGFLVKVLDYSAGGGPDTARNLLLIGCG